jgi:hypothetical protein
MGDAATTLRWSGLVGTESGILNGQRVIGACIATAHPQNIRGWLGLLLKLSKDAAAVDGGEPA